MWHYCGFCGRQLALKTLLDDSREMYCRHCDYVFFDSPSPAIIVAVANRGRVLLTRSVGWTRPFWGLIAGHIRSGENAEDAVDREVREEVGLELSERRIVGTYAHRQRNLVMIGFTAATRCEAIEKSKELEDAAWFDLDGVLPLRPTSIAARVVAARSGAGI
jgi:NAD+ diphosphatase